MLRRKLAGVLAATGLAADSHDGKDLAEFLENYPREELFQIPVPRADPDRGRRAAGCGTARRPGCSCARTSTAGTCPAWSTCRGTGTPPAVRLRAQEILRQGAERRLGRLQRDGRRVVGGQAAHRGAGGRGSMLPEVDEAAWNGSWLPRPPVVGRRPGRGDAPGRSARSAARVAARPVRRRDPGYLQDRRARRRRGRGPDQDPRAARVGRDTSRSSSGSRGSFVGGVPVAA